MTRFALLTLVAVGLVGCGESTTVEQRTITQHVTQTIGNADDPLAKRAVPPPMRLYASAGVQRAAQGSSCVQYVPASGEGTGVCADTPFPTPMRLTVVRPRERVRIVLRGAKLFHVAVHPFGCPKRKVTQFTLGSNGRWRVELRPGLYTLLVGVPHFHVGPRAGDTSGGIGLWVSRRRRLAVVRAAAVDVGGC